MGGAAQDAEEIVETFPDGSPAPRPSPRALPRASRSVPRAEDVPGSLAGALRLGAFFGFALVILRRGWLCDDAFISLRSVEHLLQGHGLVFNVGERVQSFTNPLWVLLLTGPHALLREPYAVLLVTGLLISLAAAWVLGWLAAPTPLLGALGLALLTMSEAYGDFSTSGLENPLSHLLVLSTLLFLLRPERWHRHPWAPWLCAGLALSTRLDNGVLLSCGLVVLALAQHRARLRALRAPSPSPSAVVPSSAPARRAASRSRAALRVAGAAALGLSPFLAWELFALVYYGSFVPNTAIAKLGVDVPRHQLLGQGVVYLLTSVERDPLTPLVLVMGAAFGWRTAATRPIALGVLLHLAYVIAVGGDFMAGRFFTVPFLAAVTLLLHGLGEALPRGSALVSGTAVCATVAALVILASPYDPFGPGGPRTIPPTGIVSERDYYRPELGLLPNLRVRAYRSHGFWRDGVAFRQGDRRVVVHDNAGLTAYAAGPTRHLVDTAGLTDPLLARLPPPYRRDWRIGHMSRPLPAGYRETLETGENRLEDPRLRELYGRLQLVTRGSLLSWERLRAIYALHTDSFNAAKKASP
ncbi:MAG: hypothetical protein GX607_23210 [Myxococcales bacterium]|jgi:arabinofuranosyltransferase|nr:hypothetical protein [Myxococcales bacterium]